MSLGTGHWITTPEEVVGLAAFNGAAIAASGQSGYLHPGDVFHRTFGGNKHLDLSQFIYVWEDGKGTAAWLMLQPRHGGWDLQVRPDLRDPALEAELTDWSYGALLELAADLDMKPDKIVIDAFHDDSVRIEALERSGWQRGDDPYFITERSTALPLPGGLPAGYTIRSAAGVERSERRMANFMRPRSARIGDRGSMPATWATRATEHSMSSLPLPRMARLPLSPLSGSTCSLGEVCLSRSAHTPSIASSDWAEP